jgi:hypothetical protein
MPNTYVALDQVTVGTAVSTVTFSSINQNYTDLVLVVSAAASSFANDLAIRIGNGSVDSGSNYSNTILTGNGSSAQSVRNTNQTSIFPGYYAGPTTTLGNSNQIIHFMNYANTTTNKTILSRSNVASGGVDANVNLWRSTVAINTIELRIIGNNIAAGSTFSLYGIANADQNAALATGGIISEDATHWYHTFGASGAFVPKQALTCDVLVVAGGGGGGANGGAVGPGGGGAGGLIGLSAQSLSVTSYPVTVGAGGVGGTAAYPTNGNNSVFNSNTAVGGGYGQTVQGGAWRAAQNGGSGGGGGISTVGNGTTGQGRNGGGNYSGGGGGAFALGGDGNGTGSVGGNGGQGATFNSIVGTTTGPFSFINAMGAATGTGQLSSGNYYYAGGGGAWNGSGGLGGGAGTNGTGTANTGGGGGGCDGTGGTKGAGGSGVVIIRYPK